MTAGAACRRIMDEVRVPDVCGFRLERALKELESAGLVNICIRRTAPPRMRDCAPDGGSRVVRQKTMADGSVELLVCIMSTRQGDYSSDSSAVMPE